MNAIRKTENGANKPRITLETELTPRAYYVTVFGFVAWGFMLSFLISFLLEEQLLVIGPIGLMVMYFLIMLGSCFALDELESVVALFGVYSVLTAGSGLMLVGFISMFSNSAIIVGTLQTAAACAGVGRSALSSHS